MKIRKMTVYEKDSGTGKVSKHPSKKWYAVFVDFAGVLRRLPLLDDERASKGLARITDSLNSLRSSGEILPPEMSRAIEDMPAVMRDRLVSWDIIPAAKAAARKPLAAHLDDWKDALQAKGSTAGHANQHFKQAQRIVDGCSFITLADISASRVEQFIANLRENQTDDEGITRRGVSAATSNHYLTAIKGFCAWLVKDRRRHDNPLVHLGRIDTQADRRHDRRALSIEELRWLLDVTENGYTRLDENHQRVKVGPFDQDGMSAADRGLLYRVAVETGLRAGELRSLTRGSFKLDGDQPEVTAKAGYTKNRKVAHLPLRPSTVALLASHLAGKMPSAAAFMMPQKHHVIDMFRSDLERARAAWLDSRQTAQERSKAEQTYFLAYIDADGLYADFHSLRHTFISNLVAGNVHPKTAQRLARHSDINLTMNLYTHLRRENLSSAVDLLPNLDAPQRQQARATGTHGKPSDDSVSPQGAFPRTSMQLGAMNQEKMDGAELSEFTNKSADFPNENYIEPRGTRTHDQRIKSPLLYQLS
jgi:integrase